MEVEEQLALPAGMKVTRKRGPADGAYEESGLSLYELEYMGERWSVWISHTRWREERDFDLEISEVTGGLEPFEGRRLEGGYHYPSVRDALTDAVIQIRDAWREVDAPGAAALVFSGEGGSIRLKLRYRPFPRSEDTLTRDLISATMTIDLGWLHGTTGIDFSSRELLELRAVLQSLREEPRAAEGVFRLEGGMFKMGFVLLPGERLQVRVEDSDMRPSGYLLRFVIDTEQTALGDWLGGVDRALEVFPPAEGDPVSSGQTCNSG